MGLSVSLTTNLVYRSLNVFFLLVINMLLSRLMGVSNYGVLSLLITNVSLFNLFTSFGTDSSIVYHTASNTFSENKIISWIVNIVLLQVILLSAFEALASTINQSLSIFNSKPPGYLWLAFLYLISISLTEKYSALLNGKQLYVLVNKALLIINGLFLGLLALFFFGQIKGDFVTYLSLFVLLQFLQAISLLFIFHEGRSQQLHLSFLNFNDLRRFFSYSSVAFFSNVIQFLAYRIDIWFIAYYGGVQELGWYSLAVRLVQFFWIASMAYATVIVPTISAARGTYNVNKINLLIRSMNLTNAVAGILLFFMAPWIIPFLFGSEYNNSVLLFQILMPGILLFCITNILAAYFAGVNRLKVNLLGSTICLLLTLLLDIVLIPIYGTVGAAAASTLAYSLTSVYFILVYCRYNTVELTSLLVFKKGDWSNVLAIAKKFLKIAA